MQNPATPQKPTNKTPCQSALTEAQVAEKYSLSRKTLQAWRMNGGGPAFVKMGKAVRYLVTDLEAFETANKRANTAQAGGAA
jgi:hypothetical protein